MLSGLLPLISPYGNVAICGNAGGIAFDGTVMPFIIRGTSLLGIASAGTARNLRDRIWQHLASDWKPRHLERIATLEVGLDELPGVFARMLAGESFGRTLVRIDRTV
jgi:acrylyl-CoA reductase (NADPH)